MDHPEKQEPEVTDNAPKPRKPFNAMWILALVGAAILILGIIQIAGARHPAVTRQSDRFLDKPTTPDSQSVAAFQQRQAEEAAKLAQDQKDKVQLDNLARQMDQADQDAYGIPPETQAQKRAMHGNYGTSGGAHYGGSGGEAQMTPKQKREAEYQKRLEVALNSTTIAVDLSSAADKAKAPVAEKTETASNTPVDVSTPAPQPKPEEKKVSYDFDSASGPTYRIFEGTIIETVLTNRINGAFVGPIDVMVTTPIYSLNHQVLLIPTGTRILGSVSSVNSGNQQRLFVAFHRAICPDGYSVSLDKFTGLDVTGQTGLRDIVNHHYLQIFGASLAIGAIGGLAQIGNGMTGFGYDPGVSIRNGISSQMAMESQQVLNRFLNQLPTFIIRERARVKVYISQDLTVPAYAAHTMNPNL